ncbi:MAG: hypothetical protein AAF656_02165 [Planctomycetota bacterium]
MTGMQDPVAGADQRLSERQARKLLAASVAEFEWLLSRWGSFPIADSETADARRAQIQSVWTTWIEQTESLLDRVRQATSELTNEVRNHEKRLRSIHQFIHPDLEAARRRAEEQMAKVAAGDFVDGKELRREFELARQR